MEDKKQEIQKWCDYCEGKIECDTSEFYTLFMENEPGKEISREDFKQIFKYFPNADELYANACHYHFGDGEPKYKPGNTDLKSWLIEMAVKDVKQKSHLMKGKPELFDIMSDPQVEFNNDYAAVRQMCTNDLYSAYYSELAYALGKTSIVDDDKAYALHEAFYGMTHDYEMVYYLFSPLMNTTIDFNIMLDFVSNGGFYAFENGKLVVTCSKPLP